MDLPSTSTAQSVGKGRRSRSETESRSLKGTLLPFKGGRKRSHTFQEGGVTKDKEDVDDVSFALRHVLAYDDA